MTACASDVEDTGGSIPRVDTKYPLFQQVTEMMLSDDGDEKPATQSKASSSKAKKRPSGTPYTAAAHTPTASTREGRTHRLFLHRFGSIQLALFARSWLATFFNHTHLINDVAPQLPAHPHTLLAPVINTLLAHIRCLLPVVYIFALLLLCS